MSSLFKSLKIEIPEYGENKGKVVAELEIRGAKSRTIMQMPDEVALQLLTVAKHALIDGVESAANDFIFELTTLIPETPLLPHDSTRQ